MDFYSSNYDQLGAEVEAELDLNELVEESQNLPTGLMPLSTSGKPSVQQNSDISPAIALGAGLLLLYLFTRS